MAASKGKTTKGKSKIVKGTTMSNDTLNELLKDKLLDALNQKVEKAPPKPKEPIKDFDEEAEDIEAKVNTTFSEEFGSLPPSGVDFGFWKHDVQDWDTEDQMFIPAVDDTHVWDYEWLEAALRAYVKNQKVLTYGPTGSGKSSSHEQLAAHLNQPFFRINGRGDMESDTLLGKVWVSNGEMHFKIGDLPEKMKKGYFVLFDEPWKTPSNIQMALQRMYERGGILQLDDMPTKSLADKQIQPHEDFRIFLADNVIGSGDQIEDYGATLIQDGSTLNRIDLVLYMDYLNHEDEVQLVRRKFPKISEQRANHMVQLAGLIRKNKLQGKLDTSMSPRQLQTWAEHAIELKDYLVPFKWVMVQRQSEDVMKALLLNEFETVFDIKV